MQFRLIKMPAMRLAGMSFFGDPFKQSAGWTAENEIGRLWMRFMDFYTRGTCLQNCDARQGVMFELHIEYDGTQETGEYEVFVGIEVEGSAELPVQTVMKHLPAADYAIFTLVGEEIQSDWWREINTRWLPENNLEYAEPYLIQYYDERYKGLDQMADSVLDVYIPVRTKTKGDPE